MGTRLPLAYFYAGEMGKIPGRKEENMIKFGPAGNSDSFRQKYKSSTAAPGWLKEMGLQLLEYQCGRGVNLGEETGRAIGQSAQEAGIGMSVHSPYFINLSSGEAERREKNVGYILQSCQAAHWLGADRVVVHCGGLSKLTREEALQNTFTGLREILQRMEQEGCGDVTLCVETMGKQNVMGTLEEVAAICQMDERLLPCIDFGHLNAREQGSLRCAEDHMKLLEYLISQLGKDRMRHFHVHFSHIEYGKGGEVRHLTFEDKEYGPWFDDCAQALLALDLHPWVICESAGTQAEDALLMQQIYQARARGEEPAIRA